MQVETTRIESLDRGHSLRAGLLLAAVGLLSIVVAAVDQAQVYLAACLLAACWVIPIWWNWTRGTLDLFEPVHVLGLLTFLYFGVGAISILSDPGANAYDWNVLPYLPRAIWLCLFGYLALLAGYYLPWSGRKSRESWVELPRSILILAVPGALGLMGHLAGSAWYWSRRLGVGLPGYISSLGQFAPLFAFAWTLGWMLVLSGRATRHQRLLVFSFLCPGVGIIAMGAMNDKSLIMELAVLPLVCLWYARHRFPWKTLLLLGLVSVFVIFPVNNTYRRLDPRFPAGMRAELTSQIIRGWSFREYIENSIGAFQARMALINSVAVVIRDVPRWVPYAEGSTVFMPALVSFVPRVAWPDKPIYQPGREFAIKFRVIHVLDKATNVAPTLPGELYWNYDIAGILLGMAFWGFVVRWVYRRYGEAEDMDPIRRSIYIAALLVIVHYEGHFAGQFLGVVRLLAMLEALRWTAKRMGWIEVRRAEP